MFDEKGEEWMYKICIFQENNSVYVLHDFIKFLEGIKNNINKILGQKIDPYRWW